MMHVYMFLASLVLDFVATTCLMHISKRHIWRAGFYSFWWIYLGASTTLSWLDDHSLIYAACIGHSVGTMAAIFLGERNERTSSRRTA